MKLCKKCNTSKDHTEFNKNTCSKDGLQSYCKNCGRSANNNAYKKYKDKKSTYRKKHYSENKEKENLKNKEWRTNNLVKCKESARSHYQKNKQAINLKRKIRAQNDSKIRIDSSMRLTISLSLNGKKNRRSWKNLVNYSLQELLDNLESKFTTGMNWGNYGKGGWEVDHIIPKYYFKYTDTNHPAFKACWALDNLQPLWATTEIAISYGEDPSYTGNRDKNNKIIITDEIKKILDSVNIEALT